MFFTLNDFGDAGLNDLKPLANTTESEPFPLITGYIVLYPDDGFVAAQTCRSKGTTYMTRIFIQGVPVVVQQVMNQTGIHEDTGLIPGLSRLRIWHCCELW